MSDDAETNAVETRAADEAEMIGAIYAKGFDVRPMLNNGFVVKVYVEKRGHLEAAFTDFRDMVNWIAEAHGLDAPYPAEPS